MKRFLLIVLLLVFALGASYSQVLNPGDNMSVNCAGGNLAVTPAPSSLSAYCVGYTPTPAVTATATVMPACCAALWHGPDGSHEHGDAPPPWIGTAHLANPLIPTASFNFVFNTPGENATALKHGSFKGFAASFGAQSIYVLAHFDTNPSGRAGTFHSFQTWLLDATGAVSYLAGWNYFGLNAAGTGPIIAAFGCDDTTIRPVMQVNRQGCEPNNQTFYETWYPAPAGYLGRAGFYPDFGFSASPNYWDFGAASNPSTWVPTGQLNLSRRLEFSWYAGRSPQRGAFWVTQLGQVVSGPADPACGLPFTVAGRTFTTLCGELFIAPSLQTIDYASTGGTNNYSRTWPGPIGLPN